MVTANKEAIKTLITCGEIEIVASLILQIFKFLLKIAVNHVNIGKKIEIQKNYYIS